MKKNEIKLDFNNMEIEKQLFIMGVTLGRELQVTFEKNKEALEKQYCTLLDWEAEQIHEYYKMIKETCPELFNSK